MCAPQPHRNMVASGGAHRIATLARPALRQHATSTSSRGSSSGVAGGRSAQSTPGSPARSSRHLANIHCLEHGVAADPNARRLDRAGFLPGGIALQRSAARPRTFYWRGILNRQYVLDLDDAGRSELPVMGRSITPQPTGCLLPGYLKFGGIPYLSVEGRLQLPTEVHFGHALTRLHCCCSQATYRTGSFTDRIDDCDPKLLSGHRCSRSISFRCLAS